jgi:hypothetical protein
MTTVVTSGTQAATLTTKHQLYTTASAGVYELLVDTTAMANGDVLELFIDAVYKSGGSSIQTHYATFAHVQSDPGKVSVPVVAPYGATFHLKQTLGTGRSYDWCITVG